MLNTDDGLLAQALAHIEARKYDEALAPLKQLVGSTVDPQLVHGLLASVHAELGRDDEAVAHYERVLALNPDNPLARQQLDQLRARAPGSA
jgi:predicted Zn-dependent protease